ncbi:MAG: IS66 family transposase [Nitrospira sp.]|nr:IS66 family transposase [Nitrospira sp.]
MATDAAATVALLAEKDRSISDLKRQVAIQQHQLDWMRRQIFGRKSERVLEIDPLQMALSEVLPVVPAVAPVEKKSVAAHTRTAPRRDAGADAESVPFFDESKVPVIEIALSTPEIDALSPEQYDVIGQKISYRIAQQPASNVVLKYTRPVIKRLDTQALISVPAPTGVIDGSRADVSFLAGLLVDKFVYHMPLYRQHQKLGDGGIQISRPWLTQLAHKTIALLEPIHAAQLASIRRSRVISMDETGIKAGRDGPGKMHQGYFWPVYGEHNEICFVYANSRRHTVIDSIIGASLVPGAVLLTDGYAAYEAYARKTGIAHARCWAHARREFFQAQAADPDGAAQALAMIRALYAVEERIRERKLGGQSKLAYRHEHAKPIYIAFFDWIDRQFERQGLLPSTPYVKALGYARERRSGLGLYLADPDVPIDNNHLERGLRAIPMGRKNWMFCWSELGAKQVGIVQSLLVTCRLHGIDPYTYLIDVLQRVGQHPASQTENLTPRVWNELFATNPMRSVLHSLGR